MNKLSIKTNPDINPDYIAKIEEGERAVHSDVASFLADAGNYLAKQRCKKPVPAL